MKRRRNWRTLCRWANKRQMFILSKQDEQLKIVREEADFESKKLQEKYTAEINQVNEESLKIKNQIITLKKKKDTFFIQTDSLKEINKEKVG